MTDLLSHIEIIPASPAHLPWMLATFRHQVGRVLMTGPAEARAETAALARILRGRVGKAAVAVPVGDADDGMGWAVSLFGGLLAVYVSADFRRQGIGATLISMVAPAVPVRVAFWTRDVQAMQAGGFPIVYSIEAFQALCRYARRDDQHQQARVA